MKKCFTILLIAFLLFLNCERKSADPNLNDYSVIGKIVDEVSGQACIEILVRILNNQNAYHTITGTDGSFRFQSISRGEYFLTVEVSKNGKTLTDTCGKYSTDTQNWGTIYTTISYKLNPEIVYAGHWDGITSQDREITIVIEEVNDNALVTYVGFAVQLSNGFQETISETPNNEVKNGKFSCSGVDFNTSYNISGTFINTDSLIGDFTATMDEIPEAEIQAGEASGTYCAINYKL